MTLNGNHNFAIFGGFVVLVIIVGYDYVEIYGAFLITCQSSTLIWIPKLKFPVPYTLYYAPLCIALRIKTWVVAYFFQLCVGKWVII